MRFRRVARRARSLGGLGRGPPRDAAHGDAACNAALVLAKQAKRKPREIAEMLVAPLQGHETIRAVEVAGPGFVNLRLTEDFWRARLAELLATGSGYGAADIGRGRRVNVEYVSANPTGPLHVGHARGAVVGDRVGQSARAHGLRGDAGILRQRRRRAGGHARPLRPRPLPRGLRRDDRRHPGRALSRRLSGAGGRGARGARRPPLAG